MAITIQVEEQVAEALKSLAEAGGLSLEEYLRKIAENAQPSVVPPNGSAADAVRDFDAALDELFAGDARKLPSTPLTYSREDIYFDHD